MEEFTHEDIGKDHDSKTNPQPPQDTAWLDEILHNLQAELFSDHTRVLKGKDTLAEMDSNNADTLARTKAAILAHLNTGQPTMTNPARKCQICGFKVTSDDPAEHGIGFPCGIGISSPQPLEDGELDDQITLAVAKRFLHERYDAVTQLFKAELERREREAQIDLLRRIYCCDHSPEDDDRSLNVCSGEHLDLLAQLTPTPESKQSEEQS